MRQMRERPDGAALFNRVVRIAVLILAFGVMGAGLVIAVGWVQLRTVPEEFRAVMGIVIFLYGLYRFVLAFIRRGHGR
ncbi:MAG TPA: hypothetical protein VF889_02825 [Bacteroidota bacterium]